MLKQILFILIFCSSLFAGQDNQIETNSPVDYYNSALKLFNSDDENYNPEQALKLFKKAAESGMSDAQFQVGWIYNAGIGVETNIVEAIKWYKKAAEQGESAAANNIGYIYETGNGVPTNEANALSWYLKSVKNENLGAAYNLASFYEKIPNKKIFTPIFNPTNKTNSKVLFMVGNQYFVGNLGKTNKNKSLFWYKIAANQNNAAAQNILGLIYMEGEIVSQNYNLAFSYFSVAITQNFADAENSLGYMYKKGLGVQTNVEKAFEWYKKAANQNNESAQANLGLAYKYVEGVEKNLATSLFYFSQSASNGCALSQFELGWRYEDGIGVTQDYKKTVEWYERAIKNGNPDALYNLAELYEKGLGVSNDTIQAFILYSDSAKNGNVNAQERVANMYYFGNGTMKNREKALKWYLKAAENGDTASFYRIAIIYDKQKNKKAFDWFVKSAESGDHYADFKLGYIFFEGKYTQKNLDKALDHFQKVLNSDIKKEIKGTACLMIGGIQLKQGKTAEGFATLKKAVKYPLIKKILTVLIIIAVCGGVIFITAVFFILYFVLKNNKSFSSKKSWSIVEAVAIMGAFIALQIGMSLMIVVPFFDKICKDIFLKLIFWTFIGNSIVIFIAVILAKIRPISVWKQFGFVKINFKKWLMLIVGSWISIIAIGVVYEQVLKIFGIKLDGQMINQELQKYDNVGSIIFLILIIGFIMPVIEELIFRGVLFQALRAKMSAFWSILISSVIFAAVHGDPVYFIPLLATGIVCSYVFEKTKSIYTPIGVHILNNLFVVVVTILFSN